ncbi:helicase-associated domain-containing protein [Rathayibacter soli]|uniref:helicase-associated domain-containing protein n=1 Tax=Rathayibacter soli TaxID=3144168 RepID=UPI0027E4FDD3|nr:helicase-associated domain-containing protein [Glaciibacter superstes]
MTGTLALALQLGRLGDDELRTVLSTRAFHPARINDLFDLAEALLTPESIQSALARLDRPTLALVFAAAAAADDDVAGIAGTADVRADAATPVAELTSRLARWGATPTTLGSPQMIQVELDHLARLQLIRLSDRGVSVYSAVRQRLAAWPSEGLPSGRDLAATPPPGARTAGGRTTDPGPQPNDRLAAEQGFSAIGATAALLTELSQEPARLLQKGGIAHPDTRRLAAATGLPDDTVATLLWCADKARLTAIDGASLLATHAASEWFGLDTRARWASLANGWRNAMPDDVRRVLTARPHEDWADGLVAFAHWLFPADPKRLARRLETYGSAAALLGISIGTTPTRAGILLLNQGADAASAVIAEHLPAEIDRVYLQPDLTIIAPGPLQPAIDTRLRTFADLESRALASTFRVSAASITRAIAAGEDAAGLRTFLQEISLTGIPQPLDYLLTETAARYGLIRVVAVCPDRRVDQPRSVSLPKGGRLDATDAGGSRARSRIHSADTGLLERLEIDQTLASLGLTRSSDHQLESRFERDVVFWALSDARYPVAAEDTDGTIIALRRRAIAPRTGHRSVDPLGALLARLRASGSPDEEGTLQAWLARQLDAAVHSRSTLIITVAAPGGGEREYTLEPTGLGGGRVRGRDRTVDVERTLPLSSIRGIRTPPGAE